MREDKVRRKEKGKRGKGEGRMGANNKGADYAMKRKKNNSIGSSIVKGSQ